MVNSDTHEDLPIDHGTKLIVLNHEIDSSSVVVRPDANIFVVIRKNQKKRTYRKEEKKLKRHSLSPFEI